MVVRSACPTPAQLEQLVLGQPSADPVDELEHVAGCRLRPTGWRVCRRSTRWWRPSAARRRTPHRAPSWRRGSRRSGNLPVVDTVTHVGARHVSTRRRTFGGAPDLDRLETLGPFRVIRQLGAGGMGVVLLAEDTRLKRQVAVKVIRPGAARPHRHEGPLPPREAEAIAAVEHENIVPIHEVNEHAGIPYLVMPYPRGRSLETRLREQPGPLPVAEVVRLGRQIAAGVAAAHRRGLIHRDIKPGNGVFLVAGDSPGRRRRFVCCSTFGLAAALHADEPTTTEGGTVIVGTPGSARRSRRAAGRSTAAADLFSLSCVLYRMAAGRAPVRGRHADRPAVPDGDGRAGTGRAGEPASAGRAGPADWPVACQAARRPAGQCRRGGVHPHENGGRARPDAANLAARRRRGARRRRAGGLATP
ncbi:MAG: serine/threonine-protein kinase [Gemmataceae bacterium]